MKVWVCLISGFLSLFPGFLGADAMQMAARDGSEGAEAFSVRATVGATGGGADHYYGANPKPTGNQIVRISFYVVSLVVMILSVFFFAFQFSCRLQ